MYFFKDKYLVFLAASIALTISEFAPINADASAFNSEIDFESKIVKAADQSNIDILKSLLDQGGNPNEKGKFEATGLHRAAFNGHKPTATLLITAGADINAQDFGGATPLHIAVRQGNTDMVRLLIQNGADINIKDEEGYTPLHRAIINNSTPASLVLLEAGAEPNTTNRSGDTPIIDAAKRSNNIIVEELIAKGADKTKFNNRGYGANDYAEKNLNQNVITSLSKSKDQILREKAANKSSVIVVNESDIKSNAAPAFLSEESTNVTTTPLAPAEAAIEMAKVNSHPKLESNGAVPIADVTAIDIPELNILGGRSSQDTSSGAGNLLMAAANKPTLPEAAQDTGLQIVNSSVTIPNIDISTPSLDSLPGTSVTITPITDSKILASSSYLNNNPEIAIDTNDKPAFLSLENVEKSPLATAEISSESALPSPDFEKAQVNIQPVDTFYPSANNAFTESDFVTSPSAPVNQPPAFLLHEMQPSANISSTTVAATNDLNKSKPVYLSETKNTDPFSDPSIPRVDITDLNKKKDEPKAQNSFEKPVVNIRPIENFAGNEPANYTPIDNTPLFAQNNLSQVSAPQSPEYTDPFTNPNIPRVDVTDLEKRTISQQTAVTQPVVNVRPVISPVSNSNAQTNCMPASTGQQFAQNVIPQIQPQQQYTDPFSNPNIPRVDITDLNRKTSKPAVADVGHFDDLSKPKSLIIRDVLAAKGNFTPISEPVNYTPMALQKSSTQISIRPISVEEMQMANNDVTKIKDPFAKMTYEEKQSDAIPVPEVSLVDEQLVKYGTENIPQPVSMETSQKTYNLPKPADIAVQRYDNNVHNNKERKILNSVNEFFGSNTGYGNAYDMTDLEVERQKNLGSHGVNFNGSSLLDSLPKEGGISLTENAPENYAATTEKENISVPEIAAVPIVPAYQPENEQAPSIDVVARNNNVLSSSYDISYDQPVRNETTSHGNVPASFKMNKFLTQKYGRLNKADVVKSRYSYSKPAGAQVSVRPVGVSPNKVNLTSNYKPYNPYINPVANVDHSPTYSEQARRPASFAMSSRSTLVHPYKNYPQPNQTYNDPHKPASIRMRPRINQQYYDKMYANVVLSPQKHNYVKTVNVDLPKKEVEKDSFTMPIPAPVTPGTSDVVSSAPTSNVEVSSMESLDVPPMPEASDNVPAKSENSKDADLEQFDSLEEQKKEISKEETSEDKKVEKTEVVKTTIETPAVPPVPAMPEVPEIKAEAPTAPTQPEPAKTEQNSPTAEAPVAAPVINEPKLDVANQPAPAPELPELSIPELPALDEKVKSEGSKPEIEKQAIPKLLSKTLVSFDVRTDNSLNGYHSFVGPFSSANEATTYYTEIATRLGVVYNYKLVQSKDGNYGIAIGKVRDSDEANKLCTIFKSEKADCTVTDAGKADSEIVNQRKVYAILGEFKTPDEANGYINSLQGVSLGQTDFAVAKASENSSTYLLQIGPVSSGEEAKEICDTLKQKGQQCKVAVK